MKKIIRLTETDIRKIVKESVSSTINEMYQKEFKTIYNQVEQAYYSLDNAYADAKKKCMEKILLLIN